ncbi:uncharacterized protein SAPINGB_P006054 [Magnusiomyces paraingens]|uniref:Translation initiation factor 5A C-terminal domain-containing protein n=1 Tax=Magnusiomyces paraingens TaxID=2606893 RepID=A0A5E8C301_9ASCO|nr:uncharacterized protein SAPINGB_P006054 [Saprochaete ingens]VVT58134.1 unnamed protein product [Saprochaete ingens]
MINKVVKCSSLCLNDIAVIKGRPCQICEISRSDSHVNISGIDLFNGKEFKDFYTYEHPIEMPKVERRTYKVIGLDGGQLLLLNPVNGDKIEIELPRTIAGDDIKEQFTNGKDVNVKVLKALGKAIIATYEVAY